jgi:hypothetical protein
MGKARKTDITFDVSFAAQRIKHLSSEQVPKLMRHLLSRKESQLKAPRSDGHKPNSITVLSGCPKPAQADPASTLKETKADLVAHEADRRN